MNYEFGPGVQFDETQLDGIYKEAFGYKTDGTFVEVGAYDGYQYSHTWGLAKIGWRGVYVEPVWELAQKCRDHHKNNNVIVVQSAAGSKEGESELFIDEFSCCGSTMNPTVCKNPKKVQVTVELLDDILFRTKVKPSFELLSIDVEYNEVEVLKGFSLDLWRPKLIMIELCELLGGEKTEWSRPARELCDQLMPKNGYSRVYVDKLNTIFLRK
jgi:FkbM family methyltransferase